jgi:hypothetical protein
MSNKTMLKSKFVKVSDDWYPNYNNDEILVKIRIVLHPLNPFLRISAWGDDDFGMDMDFYGTIEELEKKYDEWKHEIYDKIPKITNQEYFKNLGFKVF